MRKLRPGSRICLNLSQNDSKQTAVHFGDLDLTTEAGRATLDARITRAARIVCSSQIETGTILRGRANPVCVAAARAQIERQVAVRTASSKLGG